jgi:diguanylate cyclase (GGDEF)-like protein/PAS domain S-box-containing protein
MNDTDKTKEELINKLTDQRQQILRMEKLEMEFKQTEEEARANEKKYRTLVETVNAAIFVFNGATNCYVNPYTESLTGYSQKELLSMNFWDILHPDYQELVRERGMSRQQGKEVPSTYEVRIVKKQGETCWLSYNAAMTEHNGEPAVLGVAYDITEHKKKEEELQALSLIDELTGLYNRRAFFTLAEQQLKIAKRHKTGMFMLYADMDNLKKINDTFGHDQGDLALIDIAKILKATYRYSDIVARIGGDEFVVFPVETTDDHVELITARLQNNLDIHNAKKDQGIELSLSVGIAYYDPESTYTVDELMSQADKLMYKQKKQKKEC